MNLYKMVIFDLVETAQEFLSPDLIYEVLDPILFEPTGGDPFDREYFQLRITQFHDTHVLRTGEAVLLLDEKSKETMRIDAQFRPCLRTLPTMSDSEFTATDAETVLKALERTRKSESMPRPMLEGEYQCCHIESIKVGAGSNRRNARTRCKNKAAINDLRCPIHIGSSVISQKDIQHLLVSEEEKQAQRTYHLMHRVHIVMLAPIISSNHRHPMSMEVPDTVHEKDYEMTRLLVSKFQKTHAKLAKHMFDKCPMKFPEPEYRLEFGSSGSHESKFFKP